MADNVILTRIVLEGAAEILASLRQIGEVGKATLAELSKGPGATQTSQGFDELTDKFTSSFEAGFERIKRGWERLQGSFKNVSFGGGGGGEFGEFIHGLLENISKVTEKIGIGLGAGITGLIAGLSEAAREGSNAVVSLQALANQAGTSTENILGLKSAFSSMGVEAQQVDNIFRRLALRIELEIPRIREQIRDSAANMARDILNVQSASLSLGEAQIKQANSAKEAASLQVADQLSVRSATLNLLDVQEKLRQSRGEAADPQFAEEMAEKRQLLALDNARLQLQNAQRKAQEDVALAPIRAQKEEIQFRRDQLALIQADKKAREDQLNDINNLVSFVDRVTQGATTAEAKKVQDVNVTMENVIRGLIANSQLGSGGAGVGALDGFKGSLKDLESEMPKLFPFILQLSDFMKNSGDSALNTALAYRLLGRDVSPLLVEAMQQGSDGIKKHIEEVKHLGLTYSDADILAGKSFKKSFSEFGEILEFVKNKIGLTFAPLLENQIAPILKNNFQDIIGIAENLRDRITPIVDAVFNVLTGKSIEDFAKTAEAGRIGPEQFIKVAEWQKTFETISNSARGFVNALNNIIRGISFEDFAEKSKGVIPDSVIAKTGEWQKSVTELKNVFVDVYNSVIGVLDKIAQKISQITGYKISGEQLGIALLIGQFTGLNSAIVQVGAAVLALGAGLVQLVATGALLLSFVSWPVLLTAGIVAAIAALIIFRKEIADTLSQISFKDVFKAITDDFATFLAGLQENFKRISQIPGLNRIFPFATSAEGIEAAVQKIGGDFEKAYRAEQARIAGDIEKDKAAATAKAKAEAGAVDDTKPKTEDTSVIDQVKQKALDVWEATKKVREEAVKAGEAGKEAGDKIKHSTDGASEQLKSTASSYRQIGQAVEDVDAKMQSAAEKKATTGGGPDENFNKGTSKIPLPIAGAPQAGKTGWEDYLTNTSRQVQDGVNQIGVKARELNAIRFAPDTKDLDRLKSSLEGASSGVNSLGATIKRQFQGGSPGGIQVIDVDATVKQIQERVKKASETLKKDVTQATVPDLAESAKLATKDLAESVSLKKLPPPVPETAGITPPGVEVGTPGGKAEEAAKTPVEKVGAQIGDIGQQFVDAFGQVKDKIIEGGKQFSEGFDEVKGQIVSKGTETAKALKEGSGAEEAAKSPRTPPAGEAQVTDALRSADTALQNFFGGIGSTISNLFKSEQPKPETTPPPPPPPTTPEDNAGLQETNQSLQELEQGAQGAAAPLQETGSALENVDSSAEGVPGALQAVGNALSTLVQQASSAASGLGGSGGGGGGGGGGGDQGKAFGGLIFGPGSSTSDSVPIRASKGEYVVRAAAVQHLGVDFMHHINSAPGFAMGGIVGALDGLHGMMFNTLPRFAEGGQVRQGTVSSGRPLVLNLDGKQYTGTLHDQSASKLENYAVSRQISSIGRKPSWY